MWFFASICVVLGAVALGVWYAERSPLLLAILAHRRNLAREVNILARMRADAKRQFYLDRLAERADQLQADRYDRDRTTRQQVRALDLQERDVRLREEAVKAPTPMPPIPPDVYAIINAWDEEWAKSEMARVVQDVWADTASWDAVRLALRDYAIKVES